MEIEPEYLPPETRRGERERVYEFHGTVRQVHPLVGLLIGLAFLALMAVLFVFFFWVGVVVLCLAAVGMVLRMLLRLLGR